MEDGKIIELFFARDEQALDEVKRKYGRYCDTVAEGILGSSQDAEEVVSDAWLKAWDSIPPQKPVFLKLFLGKMVRNLAFSRWRSRMADKRGGGEIALALEELGECIPGREAVDDRLNAQELAQTIRTFLNALPEREQDIFLRRYFYAESTAEIAKQYDMKNDNVLRILSRIRGKLKIYLTEEGYYL